MKVLKERKMDQQKKNLNLEKEKAVSGLVYGCFGDSYEKGYCIGIARREANGTIRIKLEALPVNGKMIITEL